MMTIYYKRTLCAVLCIPLLHYKIQDCTPEKISNA